MNQWDLPIVNSRKENAMDRYREKDSRTQKTLKFYQTRYLHRRIDGTYEEKIEKSTYSLSYTTGDVETMHDSTGDKHSFHECVHTKSRPGRLNAFSSTYNNWDGTPPPNNGYWRVYAVKWQNEEAFIHHSTIREYPPSFSLSDVDWSSLVSTVGTLLDGHMQANASILVELAQLGQTVGMLKNPYGLFGLPKFVRNGLSLGKLAKTSANLWLETRYGWQNLWLSIRELANTHKKVRAHLDYLQKTKDKYTPVHARSDVSGSTNSWGYNNYKTTPYNRVYLEPCTAQRYGTFGCQIKRPDPVTLMTKIDSYIRGYGGLSVVEALWDVVPFSFVVDWFIDLGRLVKRPKVDWGRYLVTRLGYSDLVQQSCRLKLRNDFLTNYGSEYRYFYSEPFPVYTSYTRLKGFPPSSESAGLFGSLSKIQLIDLSALLLQRL
jgi:hypothetical protein